MGQNKINMTEGPIFSKLLRFAIPVYLTNLLQQLYSVADTVVVGKFDGKVALAAVGATGTLTNLFLLMFTGVAAGAGVVVAQHIGAGKEDQKKRAIETSLIFSFVSGIALVVIGWFFSRPMLLLMDCPENVLEPATLYMRIYFMGAPASLFYNFGSCVLRAHGDTKRPMFILTLAGIVNVILNLILVIVFHMSVAGVALATVASQVVTAVCAGFLLFHPHGDYRVRFFGIRFDGKEMIRILKIGIPVGINGILFSVSNVIIQREVNGFGAVAIAGNTAASALDRITHLGIVSFSQAAISFAGQNVGAKKYRRLDGILWQSSLGGAVVAGVFSAIFVIFNVPFLSFFIKSTGAERSAIIACAVPKLVMVGIGYMILAPEDTLGSMLKGMGKSTTPVIINLICVTGIRMLWVFLVFYQHKTGDAALWVLYAGYPVSWVVSCIGQLIAYRHFRRHEYSNAVEDAAREEEQRREISAETDPVKAVQ
ncbi:MAG: MATE family efflux transporter [Clostridia bacterium]|nr:MATE family efflux transporter [Clostridia bacterium]